MKIITEIFHRWWILLLILFPQIFPPYTSVGYDIRDWGMVNAYILTHPIKNIFSQYAIIFQIIPITLLLLIFIYGKRSTRIFDIYISFCYLIFAFTQSISINDRYGFSICMANIFSFSILGIFWLYESVIQRNQLEIRKPIGIPHIFLVLALIAFWGPVNPNTLLPDFNPNYILTSGTGLTFCMLTPVILSVMILSYPKVNIKILGATSIMGVVIGLGNMILEFVIYPAYWWIGILHIVLLLTSAYSFWLSIKPAQPANRADLAFG
jgi:hypothetical protein